MTSENVLSTEGDLGAYVRDPRGNVVGKLYSNTPNKSEGLCLRLVKFWIISAVCMSALILAIASNDGHGYSNPR